MHRHLNDNDIQADDGAALGSKVAGSSERYWSLVVCSERAALFPVYVWEGDDLLYRMPF